MEHDNGTMGRTAVEEGDMTRIGHGAPQDLILQVQAWRGEPLQSALHARLSGAGGTLGRAPGNDLVLDDPAKFISRRHASITWRDGRFYLTDDGGNPSIVNDRPLGPGAAAALGDGDRIVIGDYLIIAALVAAAPAEVAAVAPSLAPSLPPSLPPFQSPPPAAPAPLPSFAPPIAPPRATDTGPTDALAGASILHRADPASLDADPLGLNLFAGLGEPAQPIAARAGQYVAPAFRGAESDHVAPELHAMTMPAPAQAIPDGYDPMADVLPPPPPAAAAVPPPRPAPQPVPAPQPAPMNAGDSAVLAALLDGLGLPELRAALPPEELAREVGRMLRAATAGTMDVLMARALTKRESHIDLTMIAPRANNPLKFFPDADAALTQMLGAQVPGYLAPLPALAGAFDDLKAHELAVIAGMRAALDAVVQRFDPARIEGRLAEPGPLDRLLPGGRKARLWDRLVASYGELARDADEDLQRLFGEKFSVAYEQQVARLRSERMP